MACEDDPLPVNIKPNCPCCVTVEGVETIVYAYLDTTDFPPVMRVFDLETGDEINIEDIDGTCGGGGVASTDYELQTVYDCVEVTQSYDMEIVIGGVTVPSGATYTAADVPGANEFPRNQTTIQVNMLNTADPLDPIVSTALIWGDGQVQGETYVHTYKYNGRFEGTARSMHLVTQPYNKPLTFGQGFTIVYDNGEIVSVTISNAILGFTYENSVYTGMGLIDTTTQAIVNVYEPPQTGTGALIPIPLSPTGAWKLTCNSPGNFSGFPESVTYCCPNNYEAIGSAYLSVDDVAVLTLANGQVSPSNPALVPVPANASGAKIQVQITTGTTIRFFSNGASVSNLEGWLVANLGEVTLGDVSEVNYSKGELKSFETIGTSGTTADLYITYYGIVS